MPSRIDNAKNVIEQMRLLGVRAEPGSRIVKMNDILQRERRVPSRLAGVMKSTRALSLALFLVASLVTADDSTKDKATARMVHYSGRVQGVGFRAKAVEIARDFPATGWVKNLDDGRVQLLVEGRPDAVQKYLGAVRQFWKTNIEKEVMEQKKPSGDLRDFSIKR